MEDLSRFRRPNATCAEHGKRGNGNLVVCGRSGGTNRPLRCRRCQARFSERKGTVFFRSHLPAEAVVSILSHMTEGVGMRKTGRLVGVKEDAVIRHAKLADARRGDNWDHVAVDGEHRPVLSTVPGKRSAEHVQELVDDVKRRTGGRVPRLITADGYAPYRRAILNAYGTRVVPGQTSKPGRPATTGRLAPPPSPPRSAG